MYKRQVQEYLNPLVIFAYGIFFGTTLLGILAYKGMPVSLGPVLETTAYFYITVFGVVTVSYTHLYYEEKQPYLFVEDAKDMPVDDNGLTPLILSLIHILSGAVNAYNGFHQGGFSCSVCPY